MQPKYDAIYRALVTSNVDTTNSGKIRVQCPQVAGLAEIRSAEPVNAQEPIPDVGTTVWIGFSGGDITKPYYISNSAYMVLNNVTGDLEVTRNFVAPNIQSGSLSVSFTSLTSTTIPVTFPTAFGAGVTPNVMTNIASGSGTTSRWGSRAIGVTNTGFTLFLFRGDATDPAETWASIPVQWFAQA